MIEVGLIAFGISEHCDFHLGGKCRLNFRTGDDVNLVRGSVDGSNMALVTKVKVVCSRFSVRPVSRVKTRISRANDGT